MKSGAIFDCLDSDIQDRIHEGGLTQYIIDNYEMKMGSVILDAGYGLRPLIRHDKGMIVTKENAGDCHACENENVVRLSPSCGERAYYKDMWLGSRLKSVFDGRIPSLEDVLFFKTSRYLSPEIARQINYTDEVTWNLE